nr:hypothetical protein B0A51_15536 [Rachicladosporium sp. CCFEE 5018]
MCIIEQKTYVNSDGQQSTYETTRRCRDAAPGRLCSNVQQRKAQTAKIIETKPSTAASSSGSSDGLLVTQAKDGSERRYHDLSRQSSLKETVRRSNTTGGRNSVEATSSPSIVRPSTRPTLPKSSIRRSATPHPSTQPPSAEAAITPEGTAVYDRPPSLEMPRASENERRRSHNVSFTSSTAPASDYRTEERTPARKRPSLSVDTTGRSSSSPGSTPGLSRLPTVRTLRDDRHDSARDIPIAKDSRSSSAQTSRSTSSTSQARVDSDIARLREAKARISSSAQQDQHLADLEQARYTARERQRLSNAAAEEARDAASRERHRKEAAASLEGRQREEDIEFELRQLQREKNAAAARRISREREQQRYSVSEPPMPISTTRRLYRVTDAPVSPIRDSRPRTSFQSSSTSPLSPRRRLPELAPRPRQQTVLHQPILPPRADSDPRPTSSSIRARGLEVLGREHARAAAADGDAYTHSREPLDRAASASDRLQDAFGSMRLEERRPEGFYGAAMEGREYVSEGMARREERKRRGGGGGWVWR